MLAVHEKGSGVCGVYTLEIAETKVKLVSEMARNDQHPLKCILEKE
jgi:ATP-dependent Clp protease adaptor protein ClpS